MAPPRPGPPDPPTPSAPGASKRKSALKRAALVVGAFVLVGAALLVFAGAVVVPRVVDAPFVERRLTEALQDASDGLYEARLDDVRFSLLARSAEASGLRIAPREGAPESQLAAEPILYRVRLPRLRVEGVGLWDLLRGRGLSLGTVEADSAHVRLTFTGSAFDEGDEGEDFRLRLGRLGIAGGLLVLENAPSGDTHRFEGVALAVRGVDTARETARLLAAADVTLAVDTIRGTAERGHYRYQTAGRATASSRDSTLRAGQVSFEPAGADDGRAGPTLLAARGLEVDGADWLALFSRFDYLMREARLDAPDVRLRLGEAGGPAAETDEEPLLMRIGRLVAEDGRAEVTLGPGEAHRLGGLHVVAENVDSRRAGGPDALPFLQALTAQAARAAGSADGGALVYQASDLRLATADGTAEASALRFGPAAGAPRAGAARGTGESVRVEGLNVPALAHTGRFEARTVRLGRFDLDVIQPPGPAAGPGEAPPVRIGEVVLDRSRVRWRGSEGAFEADGLVLRAAGVDTEREGLRGLGREVEVRAARLAGRAQGYAFRTGAVQASSREGRAGPDVVLDVAGLAAEGQGYALRSRAVRASSREGRAVAEGLALTTLLAPEAHVRRTGEPSVRLDAARLALDGLDLAAWQEAAPRVRLGTARLTGWQADVLMPGALLGGDRPPGVPPERAQASAEDPEDAADEAEAFAPRAPRALSAEQYTAFRDVWPLRRTDAARALDDALRAALPTQAQALVAEPGRLRVRDAAGDRVEADGVALRVRGLDTRAPRGRVLASRDVEAAWQRAEGTAEAGLYAFAAGALRASTAQGTLALDGLRYEPTVADSVIVARASVRTDPTRVRGGSVRARGVDFAALQEFGAFVAREIVADSLGLHVYIDRGLPPDPEALFPHQAARAAPFAFRVDTLVVRGARLVQREKAAAGPRPGRLVFADVGLRAGNLTNDPARMTRQTPLTLDFNALFGEAGPLHYALRYPLLEPEFEMEYAGRLGGMEIAPLNASLVPVVGVEVREGRIDSLGWRFEAGRDTARGVPRELLKGGVRHFYRDLDVALVRQEDGGQGTWQRVLSFLANNFVVRSANQPSGDPERDTKGVRYLIRNEDVFFDVLYNSVLEGVVNETIFFF